MGPRKGEGMWWEMKSSLGVEFCPWGVKKSPEGGYQCKVWAELSVWGSEEDGATG